MTGRIRLDDLTSDQLDALYEQLDKAEQEATATATAAAHLTSLVLDRAERAEARLSHLQTTSEAAGILLTRTTDERDRLQAAIDRVRALRNDWAATPRWVDHVPRRAAAMLTAALDGTPEPTMADLKAAEYEPASGTAATQATDGCTSACHGVTGIRGLLEHAGIDTNGRDITVAGHLVDPAPVADDDPPVQCWHTEADSPCDWDVCRQPERLRTDLAAARTSRGQLANGAWDSIVERDQARERADRLAAALREVLDCITFGLGQPDPDNMNRWRAALNQPKEPS